jgi:sec-independent protein translocase protein TatC
MSLADHLRELRNRLFVSAIAILVAAVVGFLCADFVRDAMRGPIDALAETRNATISYGTVTGAFDLLLQITFTLAIVIASPVWIYQIFAFLVPGLTTREKRFIFGFFFAAVPLFVAGACAGWYVFPHMVDLLAGFAPEEDATFLDARIYYDFLIKLLLAVGVAFVLPVFLVLLNFAGMLSGLSIIKGWRMAILAIVLFCALATPAADILSMFILAIPMVLLYLAAAGIALLNDRRRARRDRATAVDAAPVPVADA